MAQNGFALFFLTVLIGCTFALTGWVRLNWSRIAAAARGETLGQTRPPHYKAVQRRPIDVPYVAQRMLPQAEEEVEGRGERVAVWQMPRSRPRCKQLVLSF